MGLCAEICGGWTYRKTLWWGWMWNAIIASVFTGLGILVAQKLNKLDWVTDAATGEVDETSEKLVCLDAPHSVVALVSGAVDQYGLPVQVLLNEWKLRLGNSRL